ncbi:MAG: tetratricopeptide repeat protein [Magnetococcales bacterium]|nr:tetratricopeptide repeat protein [Magnetococcales bacterium]NGZ28327.1 tetratricopeptide repeat protein [Magnetococcales bacterium]
MKPVYLFTLVLACWPCQTTLAGESTPWHFVREENPQQAEKLFLQGTEQNVNVQSLLDYGRYLNSRGEKEKAVAFLLRALLAVEKEQGKESHLLIGLLMELAQIHSQPVPLLLRAVALAEKNFGADNPWLIPLYSQLARQTVPPQAIQWQQKLLALQEKRGESPEWIVQWSRLGDLLQQGKRYSEAMAARENALALATRLQGPYHALRLRLLQQLAGDYRKLHRHEEAMTYLLPALALAESMRDNQHATLIPLLEEVALCYGDMGEPALATPFLTRALFLAEQQWGGENEGFTRLQVAMANNFHEVGNTPQAILLYQRALKFLNTEENRVEYAKVQMALGKAMADEGMSWLAEGHLRRGLQVLIKEGKESPGWIQQGRLTYGALLVSLDHFLPFATLWSEQEVLMEVQKRLNHLGLDGGTVNGKKQAVTKAAIRQWQQSLGLTAQVSLQRESLLQLLHWLPSVPPIGCVSSE